MSDANIPSEVSSYEGYDLSILIPSMPARAPFLSDLLACLYLQNSELWKRTQILVNIDAQQHSVGEKRNELVRAAEGRYVVFIDDDDLVDDHYLDEIFHGIDLGVDHIGVGMWYCAGESDPVEVVCSKDNHSWMFDGVRYLRGVQHICAVKRELAFMAGFDDTSFGEDKTYSQRVTPLVQTEYLTSHPVYFYYDGVAD